MAQTKQVKNIRSENQLRAIESQAGFVSFVVGKVNKVGFETVLKQFKNIAGESEFYWLKKAFERVLTFAEEVQYKEIAQLLKAEGLGDTHYHVTLIRDPRAITESNNPVELQTR